MRRFRRKPKPRPVLNVRIVLAPVTYIRVTPLDSERNATGEPVVIDGGAWAYKIEIGRRTKP